jgi:LemA protein
MPYIFSFILLLALIAILAIIVYNKIIKLKVRVKEGMADIQVQLKRRHNLIGNLVETVKGYASHEKETLEKVIQARNAAQQAEQGGEMGAIQSAERMLSSALSGLKINALSEAYPDLKANTNFLQLQSELTDTEDKIAASRRFYNTTVQSYNTYIQQVPGNLFKGLAGASVAEFFELEEDSKAKDVPQINFAESKAVAPAPAAPTPSPAPEAAKVEPAPATPAPATPVPTAVPETKAEEAPMAAPAPAEQEVKSEEAPAEEAIPTPEVKVEATAADQEAQTSEAEEVKSENVEVKKEEAPAPEAPKVEETQSSEAPAEEAPKEEKSE